MPPEGKQRAAAPQRMLGGRARSTPPLAALGSELQVLPSARAGVILSAHPAISLHPLLPLQACWWRTTKGACAST